MSKARIRRLRELLWLVFAASDQLQTRRVAGGSWNMHGSIVQETVIADWAELKWIQRSNNWAHLTRLGIIETERNWRRNDG